MESSVTLCVGRVIGRPFHFPRYSNSGPAASNNSRLALAADVADCQTHAEFTMRRSIIRNRRFWKSDQGEHKS